MEFLDYNQTLEAIGEFGVVERPEGDAMRFELTAKPPHAPEVQTLVIGPDAEAAPGQRAMACPTENLPATLESLLHKVHVQEVAVIPTTSWGAILDLIAFKLADEEHWNEIDAEASLHKNTRNPLVIDANDMRLTRKLLEALIENGESEEHNASIVATGAPLVIEFHQPGSLRIQCGNPATADALAETV